MSTQFKRWMFVLAATVLALVFLAVASRPVPVSAAPSTGETANACLTCHEDQYYLHDSGCLYCLTDHADRCVDCHEGDAASMKKETAHAGLLVRPQENNGAKCQECHSPEETQARLAKFASEQGFDVVVKARPYTPSVPLQSGFPDLPQANPLSETWPWLAGAFVLFGVWLALVLFSPMKP